MYKVNIEEIADKVGGPFHLAVLIQKRLKDLRRKDNKVLRALVKCDSKNYIDIICQEILEGKIRLEEDKVQYEEDFDVYKPYQSQLDEDDLAIGGGKSSADTGFSFTTDEQ